MTDLERFLSRVKMSPVGCWEWIGSKVNSRYGTPAYGILWIPEKRKHEKAHRLALKLLCGVEIPKGMEVCHHCDNGLCVKPAHLYIGTHAQNMNDMKERGRGRGYGQCGEKHHLALLTEKNVREIRRSKDSSRVWAKRLGVQSSTIRNVRQGLSWRHVK